MNNNSSKYVNMEATQEVIDKLEKDWIERTLESARNGKNIVYLPKSESPVNKTWTQVKPGDIVRVESDWIRPMVDADQPLRGNMFDREEYKATLFVKDISGTQHGIFIECLNGDVFVSINLAKECREIQHEIVENKKHAELQKDLEVLQQSAEEVDKFGKIDTMKLCDRMGIEIAMVDMPKILPMISQKAKELCDEMKLKQNPDYQLGAKQREQLRRSLSSVYTDYKIALRNQENKEIVDRFLSKNKKVIFVPQSTQLLDSKGHFIENAKIKKGQLVSLNARGVDLTQKTTTNHQGEKVQTDAVVLDVHITNKGTKYPGMQRFAIETPDCIYVSCPHLAKDLYYTMHPSVKEARQHNTEIHASQKHLCDFLLPEKHGEITYWSGPILDTYEPMSIEAQEKWEMQRQQYFDSRDAYFASVFKSCFEENIPVIVVPGDFANIGVTTDSLINSNSQITSLYPNMGESIWIPSEAKVFNSDAQFQETESVICCATYIDINDYWTGYAILTDDGLIISSDYEKNLILAYQEYTQEHTQELQEQELAQAEIEAQQSDEHVIGDNR